MRSPSLARWLLLGVVFLSPTVLAQTAADLSLLQGLSAEDRQRALQAVQGSRGESSDTAVLGEDAAQSGARSLGNQSGVGARSAGLTSGAGDASPAKQDQAAEAYDETTGLPLFGYALFGGKLANAPAANIPTPSEYLLGPGDVVRVQLFGNQNETLNLLVIRDGAINFPKLGPIQVAGLRLDDVRQLIERRVSKELIGVQANVTLGPLRSMQVFVLGDAQRPGAYSVSGQSTISQALFAGGGVALSGSLRNIQLKREGRVVRTLDLYDFLLGGDARDDLRLQSGDVIFIPAVAGRLSVAGSVKRPAVYELKGSLRLKAALEMAGGLSAEARRGQVLLDRVNRDGQRSLQELDLSLPANQEIELRDGDRLHVQSVSGQVDNRVAVLGHVRYPGPYAWSEGMNLSRLLSLAQVRPSQAGLELYPVLGLIERSNPVSGLREWSAFDLQAVRAGAQDMPLRPEDRVVILNRGHIEYLAAPEVSAALRGELPPIVPLSSQDRRSYKAQAAYPPSTRLPQHQSVEPLFAGADQDSRDQRATRPEGICPALVEVAKIATSARALTIRMMLSAEKGRETEVGPQRQRGSMGNSGASDRAPAIDSLEVAADAPARTVQAGADTITAAANGEAEISKLKECPSVFREAPTALVYLLERGVSLIGEVRRPGLYPVPDGVSYERLLASAGGATDEADGTKLDLFAASNADDGGASRFQTFELDPAERSRVVRPGEIYQLRPGRSLPEVGAITLRGEVRFPGRYLISRGERLAEVLARAGGLSETAYPYGAVFIRESARRAEAESNRRAANDLRDALATATTKGVLNQVQGQSAAFLGDLLNRLETTPPVGRIVIQADPTLLSAQPEDNLLLEPGDELYVPKRPSAVTVTGQVLNPGTLAFRSSATARDYLRQTGGFSKSADQKRLFLVLPDGSARPLQISAWNYRQEAIPPGSVIVVPRDAAPLTGLLLTERIAGIVSNLALSAAALVTINK
ncbi:hypothetical protein ED208_05980 [Stagnimonas aquatica]|uniref:Sugar transporter n=1 Tax=Stagnimonas aquatica TaxID=2689987 RepID=A0A3N0VGN4_9GAMM|nr:SLBB domain-containing protein [Stagnimonas aquatica]ROH91919.1 hypothetical protein ED208_05980 [Stagnimonas aquatica]